MTVGTKVWTQCIWELKALRASLYEISWERHYIAQFNVKYIAQAIPKKKKGVAILADVINGKQKILKFSKLHENASELLKSPYSTFSKHLTHELHNTDKKQSHPLWFKGKTAEFKML